jgi:phage terminase large subunit
VAAPIVIPYAPRDIFLRYHHRAERWACIVAHRRCGKTVACINDLIRRALELKTPHGRFAYVAPFLAQAKEVAWDYLKRFARPVTESVNEAELRLTLVTGASIRIHGADNPDRLRGAYLDGVVLDEYADMRPGVWGEVIRPMLSDRQGWATFIGTPKGHNSFHDIYKHATESDRWYAVMLRASETNMLPAEELADMRRDMTPEEYEQEAECSFEASIKGAYFGKEIAEAERQGRIRDVPYEPGLPVHTAWDLGIGDSTAIWFWQVVSGEIRIIDWYENSGQGLPHYAEVLSNKGYLYGDDWVPHDARVRELGTGKTRVETLSQLRRKPRLVPDHKIMDGINSARLALARCYFDKARCAAGIEALRQYRPDFDEKAKVFKDAPKHDWTSHTADGFRYLAMAWKVVAPDAVPKSDQEKMREAVALMLKPRTYDDIWKDDDAA